MAKKMDYLAMKTGPTDAGTLSSDFKEFQMAAKKLADDAMKLGASKGFATTFLQWFACAAAIYLLILDRTNWKTNMLTALLVPYIFLSLPALLFNLLRGEIGMWIAFVVVVLRLFFPTRFPSWLEMPGSLILLLVVAPKLLADTVRTDWYWVGLIICLVIAGYLLQEHIRASGGFKNAFSRSNGISNSIGIVLLMVYPVWGLITYLF